jgi:methylmalonyl-CoA/ethylmalonyl-CoA epimerase
VTTVRSVNHIGIVVRDLAQADHFMTSVLGLKRAERVSTSPLSPSGYFYRCGDLDIQILEDDARVGSASVGRIEHLALDVDDIDELGKSLSEAGVPFTLATPVLSGDGQTRAQFTKEGEGPLGIVLQLNDTRQGTS